MLGNVVIPRTITVNIKARRLGYVIKCLSAFKQSESLTRGTVYEKLELWSVQNKKELDKHIRTSGYISKSPKRYPAKRYVDLTSNLQLIKIDRTSCSITKLGIPLHFFEIVPSKPFELSIEQQWYLLKRLLISDFDILLPHLQLLEKYYDVPTIFLKFKKTYLAHLEQRVRSIGDIIESSEYRKRIDKIKGWTSEKKYLEDIIYPRIDWLTDLKLIDWTILAEENRYELSKPATLITSKLVSLNKIGKLKNWFETGFYTTLSKAYNSLFNKDHITFLANLSEKQKFEIIKNKLEESFSMFASSGTPFAHMSAITFLEYTCIKLLREGIVAEFDICKQILNDISGYRFRWDPIVNDGFITRV